jgi:phosphate transport system substrate-binding protein
MGRAFRLRSVVTALVISAVVGMPVFGGSAASAASGRSGQATPDSNLLDISGDGQFVTLSWSHFPKNQVVYALECERGATDPASQCSQGGNAYSICGHACPGWAYLGPSDKNGSGSSIVQVAIGVINTLPNLDPIPGQTFTCDWQHACSFMLTTDVGLLSGAVEVPIEFEKPADACPTGGTYLAPSGGAAAKRLFLSWASNVCNSPTDISLSYVLKPGTNAIDDFVQGAAPFAVTPYPMSKGQAKQLADKHETASYAPLTASALVFAFRIKDQFTGGWLTHLVLTPDLLARIFTGQITTWTDPRIEALNPGVGFPVSTFTVGRGDACEETLEMTSWIWANAKQAWIDGGARTGLPYNPFDTGPTDILPSLSTQQPNLYTGARKVASVLASGDGDQTSAVNYGWIGYVDSTWAQQYDLATVTIQYGDGSAPDTSKQVSATFGSDGTISAGVAKMTTDAQGLLQPNVAIQDPTVWPMPTISYALLPHKRPLGAGAGQLDPKVASAISELLKYAVGNGQSTLPLGYVPLPSALVTQTQTAATTLGTKTSNSGGSQGGSQPPPPPPLPPSYPPTGSTGGSTDGGGSTSGGSGTQVVLVAPKPPPSTLVAAASRAVFPGVVAVGLGSLIAGPYLLFGDRDTAGVRRAKKDPSARKRKRFRFLDRLRRR